MTRDNRESLAVLPSTQRRLDELKSATDHEWWTIKRLALTAARIYQRDLMSGVAPECAMTVGEMSSKISSIKEDETTSVKIRVPVIIRDALEEIHKHLPGNPHLSTCMAMAVRHLTDDRFEDVLSMNHKTFARLLKGEM